MAPGLESGATRLIGNRDHCANHARRPSSRRICTQLFVYVTVAALDPSRPLLSLNRAFLDSR